MSFTEIVIQKEEPWELWKIIVGSGIIGLILFLIGMFLGFRSKRSIVTNGQTKGRKQPNPYSMYDCITYDSVGVNPQALGNIGESMRRAISVYEHPGYDSIDQVLEDMTRREQPVPYNSSDANAYNGYESVDEPQRNRSRPMLDYDCIPSTIALDAVTNHDYIDENQVDGCESVGCESRGIPNSIEQSETMNIYSDQIRKDINSYLDLGAQEDHHYLELCSKEVNPYLDMGQNELNPYLDMDKKEMDGNLYTSPDPICPSVAAEADYLVLEN